MPWGPALHRCHTSVGSASMLAQAIFFLDLLMQRLWGSSDTQLRQVCDRFREDEPTPYEPSGMQRKERGPVRLCAGWIRNACGLWFGTLRGCMLWHALPHPRESACLARHQHQHTCRLSRPSSCPACLASTSSVDLLPSAHSPCAMLYSVHAIQHQT